MVWYRSVCEFPTGNVSESLRSTSVHVAEVSLLVLVYGKDQNEEFQWTGCFCCIERWSWPRLLAYMIIHDIIYIYIYIYRYIYIYTYLKSRMYDIYIYIYTLYNIFISFICS